LNSPARVGLILIYKTMNKEQQNQLEELKKRIETLGNNYRLRTYAKTTLRVADYLKKR